MQASAVYDQLQCAFAQRSVKAEPRQMVSVHAGWYDDWEGGVEEGVGAREEAGGEERLEGLGRCREEGAQGAGPHWLRGHRWQVRRRQGTLRQGQVLALMGLPAPSRLPVPWAALSAVLFCAEWDARLAAVVLTGRGFHGLGSLYTHIAEP